jgi:protein-S-isoprenylcysteine O-methyltransferase Ste14
MEWYLPITIIPGVGMLTLSTTSQIMALSSEIAGMISKQCDDFNHRIAKRKINQLSLLTRASLFLYLSIALYVFSGILGVITEKEGVFSLPNIALYTGTLTVFIALVLLNIYAFRAVKIRKEQFDYLDQII